MDCHDLHSRRWRAVNRNHLGELGGKKQAEGLHKRSRLPVLNHRAGLQEINKEPLLANNSRQPTFVSLLPLQWFYPLAAQLSDIPNSKWKKNAEDKNLVKYTGTGFD